MRKTYSFQSPELLILLTFALIASFGGCRGSSTESGDDSEERAEHRDTTDQGKTSHKDNEADQRKTVKSPPITEARLKAFLESEEEIIRMTVEGYGDVAKAYIESAQGQRLTKLGESEKAGEAISHLLKGAMADHRRESKEAEASIQEAQEKTRAAIEKRVKESGFAGFEEWEAFKERLQPVRRWRIQMEMHRQAMDAAKQMEERMQELVEKGAISEEQRDTQMASFKSPEKPEVPDMSPPLTDKELEAVNGLSLQELVPGTMR